MDSKQFKQQINLLDLGCAPTNALWVPLWLTLVGSNDSTVVGNSTTAVYFGGSPEVYDGPGGNTASLSNLLIPASAATQIPFYIQLGGNDPVVGHPGDHLFCIVYGAINFNQPLTAIARIREIRPSRFAERNIL